ncbi:MAG: hypothetical protein LBT30_07305 [Clostridiales bacterium]|jgi:hypothetical protein|nr:hypothetical protein [Clostridiales bacterium]
MGRWEMNLSSCDEFMDVKDTFFKQFYKGLPVEAIEADIIAEYKANGIADGDGEWYDIFFALADSEWRCGKLSDWLKEKVNGIIESGESVAYLRQLLASDFNLKKWSKTLDKFAEKISGTNPKPLKQIIKKPYVPLLVQGDVFAYKAADKFRGAVCVYVYISDGGESKWSFEYLIAISAVEWNNTPTVADVKNAPRTTAGWYIFDGMPQRKDIIKIGSVKDELFDNYENTFGLGVKYLGIADASGRELRALSVPPSGKIETFFGELKAANSGKLVKDTFLVRPN